MTQPEFANRVSGMIMGFTYYVMRRGDLVQYQARVLLEVESAIATSHDALASTQVVAGMLQKALNHDIVAILLPDTAYDQLACHSNRDMTRADLEGMEFRVDACAGAECPGLSRQSFPMTQGIASRSLLSRRTEIVENLGTDRDYLDLGFGSVGSAIVVPLFDPLRPARCVAIISAVDRRRRAFGWRDEMVFNRVVAAFRQHWTLKNAGDYYLRLRQEIGALSDMTSFDELMSATPSALARLLDAPQVVVIPLALGTLVPLTEQARIFPSLPAQTPPMAALGFDGHVHRAIRAWEPLFLNIDANLRSADGWRELVTYWSLDAIESTIAILPLGSRKQRIGLIFVVFPAKLPDDTAFRLRLLTAAQTIAPQLMTLAHRDRLYAGFLRPGINVHSIVSLEVGRGSATQTLRAFPDAPAELADILLQHERALDRLFDIVDMDVDTNPILLGKSSLNDALVTFIGQIRERHKDTKILIKVDDALEDETVELKLILFRMGTEAITNALSRGRAKYVRVSILRQADGALFQVEDNGTGFDPDKVDRRGGMTAFLAAVAAFCGASPPDWSGTAPGKGCRLSVLMSLLPSLSPAAVDRKSSTDADFIEGV